MLNLNYQVTPELSKPDIKTRLLTWLMRLLTHRRKPLEVNALRKKIEKYESKLPKLPPAISLSHENYADLPCDRLRQANHRCVILYFYGGGYCIRSPNTELAAIADFCDRIGAEAYLPWYRLAPEHPHPAATDDCLNTYKQLLEDGQDPQKIIIAGNSAGGGNVLSLLYQLKTQAIAMPSCALMFSPAGDALLAMPSWIDNAKNDALFQLPDILRFGSYFLEPDQRIDKRLNVTQMDSFEGYPPLYFTASNKELLRDVSVFAFEKAEQAGVSAQLDLYSGGFHSMPVLLKCRQSKVIWNRAERFVKQHLTDNSTN